VLPNNIGRVMESIHDNELNGSEDEQSVSVDSKSSGEVDIGFALRKDVVNKTLIRSLKKFFVEKFL